jgi:hypothetical protein
MRALALTLLVLSAAPALAQDSGGASSQQGETKKKKVIRLDTLTVEGRIQKPQAFYILQRSNLSFDDLNRTESFVPKVVKSVDKEPF